jgi:hypothetical protein
VLFSSSVLLVALLPATGVAQRNLAAMKALYTSALRTGNDADVRGLPSVCALADGPAVPAAESVGRFSVSKDGALAFMAGTPTSRRELLWVDRAGKQLPGSNDVLVARYGTAMR